MEEETLKLWTDHTVVSMYSYWSWQEMETVICRQPKVVLIVDL